MINSFPSAERYPPPGNVVSRPLGIFWSHQGIVSDRYINGIPMVICASLRAGQVHEEPWNEFSQGYQVTDEGYPGQLPPFEVVHRARSLIGAAYRIAVWNCEHAVKYAHGLKPESPQVALTVFLGIVAIGLIAAKPAQR